MDEPTRGRTVGELLDSLRKSMGHRLDPPADLVASLTQMINQPHLRSQLDRVGDLIDDGGLTGVYEGDLGPDVGQLLVIFGDEELTVEVSADSIVGIVPDSWQSSVVQVQTVETVQTVSLDDDGYFSTARPARGPVRIVSMREGGGAEGTDWIPITPVG